MATAELFQDWQSFYQPLFQIAGETTSALGDDAGRFVEIGNDWLDIMGQFSIATL